MPMGAQDDPKEGQNESKGRPKAPEREAQDALEQPWGDPGKTLGRPGATIPKMTGGTLFFLFQKWTGFWRPRGLNFQ